MPHWKSMMDREYLFAFDLQGRDVTVQIERVSAGQLVSNGGKKTKKPVCKFVGKEKPLALNSTNCKTIAAMYGHNTDDWAGRWVTLYPTTTEMGGETVECIRIRPRVPTPGGRQRPGKPAEQQPQQDAPAEDVAEQPSDVGEDGAA